MDKWQEIYINNCKLDDIFIEKYSDDKRLYEKNCIELLVELGEFTNETKCFKYWTIKKPDKEKILDEYADCITMAMALLQHQKLDKLPKPIETNYVLELINYIFAKTTELFQEKSVDLVKEILVNILHIKDLLDITEEELINACKKKQEIILERLNSDY